MWDSQDFSLTCFSINVAYKFRKLHINSANVGANESILSQSFSVFKLIDLHLLNMSYLVSFVLVFFSPFSIAITSLGEEIANLSAFRTFVRFVLIWICRFPLTLGVWEGLRFVIVALPGLFS